MFRDRWKERGHEGSRQIAYKLDALPHYRLFRNRDLKKGLRGADVFMLRTTVDQREWFALSHAHTHPPLSLARALAPSRARSLSLSLYVSLFSEKGLCVANVLMLRTKCLDVAH